MKDNIIDNTVKTIVNSKVLQALWRIIINGLPLLLLIGMGVIFLVAFVAKPFM